MRRRRHTILPATREVIVICDKNYQPHILEILHEGDRWLCVRRNDRTTLGVICEADTREGAILGSYEPPRNPETL